MSRSKDHSTNPTKTAEEENNNKTNILAALSYVLLYKSKKQWDAMQNFAVASNIITHFNELRMVTLQMWPKQRQTSIGGFLIIKFTLY